ncbi:MAG: trimethylamine methyltransferase [Gammaproteobacteria bacterium]|nr:MAG: trimethylamine methyltransferase [Gammaproteobacteria bacterium]
MSKVISRRRRTASKVGRARPVAASRVRPYVTRAIPCLDILDDDGLAMIEREADRLLKEVGIDFRGDTEVLKILADAGATVDGERVRFDEGLLRSIIQTHAPAEFIQHARNPARSVKIGGKNTVFAPTYGPPFVCSLDFERRYGTLEDLQILIKLAYMSDSLHHSGGIICEPTDIPVSKRHLDTLYSHIKYSDKAFMGAATSGERAADSVEIARILFGADFVDNNCCLASLVNVNSPLVLDDSMLAALKIYARAGQAVTVTPFIIAGATGPTTIAANLVQGLAETMAGVALTQLINPGTPVMAGFLSTAINMRSGAPSRGPEPNLALIAFGQLMRRLGVPWRAGGSFSTSKILDAQAMQEASTFIYSTILAGANFVIHAAGSFEGGLCTSFEKFVMDADNLSMMERMLGGITVNKDECALEAFKEVGPGEHYLGCQHTMSRYQDAFHVSTIANSDSFEQWKEAGSLDATTRANHLWKKMLDEYVPPALDPAVDEALGEYIDNRKSQLPDSFA